MSFPADFKHNVYLIIYDRFLHLGFRGPKEAFREERVKIGWSIIRQRHPLLMCKVLVDGSDLNTARFSSVLSTR